jgi:hypothetical protein
MKKLFAYLLIIAPLNSLSQMFTCEDTNKIMELVGADSSNNFEYTVTGAHYFKMEGSYYVWSLRASKGFIFTDRDYFKQCLEQVQFPEGCSEAGTFFESRRTLVNKMMTNGVAEVVQDLLRKYNMEILDWKSVQYFYENILLPKLNQDGSYEIIEDFLILLWENYSNNELKLKWTFISGSGVYSDFVEPLLVNEKVNQRFSLSCLFSYIQSKEPFTEILRMTKFYGEQRIRWGG